MYRWWDLYKGKGPTLFGEKKKKTYANDIRQSLDKFPSFLLMMKGNTLNVSYLMSFTITVSLYDCRLVLIT